MKDFAIQVWDHEHNQMSPVRGIYGLDEGVPVVQTNTTTISTKKIVIRLHLGPHDRELQHIFDKDVVRYDVVNKKGKVEKTFTGVVVFNSIKGRLELWYAEKDDKNETYHSKMFNDPNWGSCKIIGNTFQPPPGDPLPTPE